MTTDEIRQKYLNFFKDKKHKRILPAPLVLENDLTTLFTSSGMQPLVPYLLGEKHSLGKRLVDVQPCLRVQDIEEVGDNRHTTFFEMLGNWSLGDYFKEEQLKYVFDFLLDELGLDITRLYWTVFGGLGNVPKDDESANFIKEKLLLTVIGDFAKKGTNETTINTNPEAGISKEDRIFYYVNKNWWSRSGSPQQMPVGEIGGPDVEIFYDFGEELNLHEKSPFKNIPCHPNCDCGRFMEICNSVFIQYIKNEDGYFKELPQKNVDFGGGLERIAAAVNNDPDVFEIDSFKDLIALVEVGLKKKYEDDKSSYRVIVDHIKAATFLANSGIIPSNKLQGYVMRRLIRRAVVKARKLKEGIVDPNIFTNLVEDIVNYYKENYFQKAEISDLQGIIFDEVNKFTLTLEKGLKEFEKYEPNQMNGLNAFNLYQTHGFPYEVITELFEQRGFPVNEEFKRSFEEAKMTHAELSRKVSAGVFKGGLADHSLEVTRLHTAHHLLLAALQKLIDKNISQKGSNINAERLRMDFNFDRKLTDDEINKLEDLINEQISKDLMVTKKIMPKHEAQKIGAQMEFAKKYPDSVSVYFIGEIKSPFSVEFCGGPHVSHLAELAGRVKITKQESAGAGIRRVYAQIM